jgi:hypothetical protein
MSAVCSSDFLITCDEEGGERVEVERDENLPIYDRTKQSCHH